MKARTTMELVENLKSRRPLSEALQYVKKETVSNMRQARDAGKERLKNTETNYRAAELLAAEGLCLFISIYYPGNARLDLESARELVKVRRALGVPLEVTGNKEVVEGKRNWVWVEVKAEGFGGLRVFYP